jgi:hypothetical protein
MPNIGTPNMSAADVTPGRRATPSRISVDVALTVGAFGYVLGGSEIAPVNRCDGSKPGSTC